MVKMSAIYDYARAVAIVIAFIAGKQSKKAAVLFDLVLTAWFGLACFSFPKTVVSKVFGTSDLAMDCAVQHVGACFLSVALFQYMCHKSRDDTVFGSIAVSKALGFLPLLLASLYTFITNEKSVNHSGFCFLLTVFVAIWLMNVALLLETRPSIGRREHRGPVSTVVRLIFLMNLIQGLACLAFPSTIVDFLKVATSVRISMNYLFQAYGALVLSSIFISWYAPCFLRREDRRSFFVSNLLFAVLILWTTMLYCYQTKESVQTVVQHLGCLSMMTLLPSLGWYLMYREDHGSTNTYYTRSKRS